MQFLFSLVLNVVFIVLIGLLGRILCLKRRGPDRTSEPNPERPQALDSALVQNHMYEEIQLPPSPRPRAQVSECIYYKAQLPQAAAAAAI